MDPGEMYQKCMAEIAKEGKDFDYHFTETIVYATEVRYAIDALTKGKPERFWNFGDLEGDADARLWAILDPIRGSNKRKFAFVGSGPYPVTAFQLRERYPDAEITCIDNHIVAHFLSQAVISKFGMNIITRFEEAIDVDFQPFNAIVVAAMVSGKQEVIERILKTNSDGIVILRGTVDLRHDRLIQLGSTFKEDGSLSGVGGDDIS
jgi:hypothetical protein